MALGSRPSSKRSSASKHRGRIPIPSFSTEEASEPEKSDENMTTKTKTATVTPPTGDEPVGVKKAAASPISSWFDGQRLLRAEAALQVMFRSSSRNRRAKNVSRISLSELWSLVSKLSVTADSEETKEADDEKKPHVEQSSPESLKSLSTGERILHDMLYVGSPSLYQLVQDGNESEAHLEFVKFSGNRLEKLRHLMDGAKQFDQAKSDTIVSAIHNAQKDPAASMSAEPEIIAGSSDNAVDPPSQPASALPDSSATAKVVIEPFIRPDMTLEERVRARHQAKQERKASPASFSSCGTSTTAHAPDQDMLCNFADSLWSQARTIQRTQAQQWKMSGEKGPPPPPAPRCGMALADVVELLSGTRTTTGVSKTPVATTHQEKKSRKQIIQGLRELHRHVPDWITFSDEKFSKQTIVWISVGSPAKGLQSYTAFMEYAAIRAALGAHPTTTSPITKGPIVPASETGMTLRKRPLTTENKKIHADLSSPLSLVATIPPDAKKQRPSPPSPPTKKPPLLDSQKEVPVSSKKKTTTSGSKRPAAGPAPTSPPTKKARGLRINKHLIMTDADYDGGMVIQPSLGDSPRGLKRLFTQLNSGQRI